MGAKPQARRDDGGSPGAAKPDPGGQRPVVERVREVAELATSQHGVVSRAQLEALGFTRRMIGRRIASGLLNRMHRGVFAVGHRPVTMRSRWKAAALALGPGAVVSHSSAAALWGLLPFRDTARRAGRRGEPVDVTVSSKPSPRNRSGIRVHGCRLGEDERTVQLGIPVTTVARTLLDVAEEMDRRTLERVFAEAERRGLLKLSELERVCARARGRRGVKPLRRLMEEAGKPRGRSPLEDRVLALCRKYDLPTPKTNVIVRDYEVDVFWPDHKVMVEADSFEFHGHRSAFERDRKRDAEMQVAGFRVLHLTHRRLDREPAKIAAEIRNLLRLGRARP